MDKQVFKSHIATSEKARWKGNYLYQFRDALLRTCQRIVQPWREGVLVEEREEVDQGSLKPSSNFFGKQKKLREIRHELYFKFYSLVLWLRFSK